MITVLIAEDEKLIRKGIAAMVRRCGLAVDEVLEARDGLEAWEALERQPVDLLITDIRMPNLDGIALVERLQQLPQQPLVVVVSGYDDFSYAVSMLRNGVQDYLLKPLEPEQFDAAMARMGTLLEQRRSQRQSQRERYLMTLSYLMDHPSGEGSKWNLALDEVTGRFFPGDYRVLCVREGDATVPPQVLALRGVGGMAVYLVEDPAVVTAAGAVGVSLPQQGAGRLHEGYLQAMAAWRQGFFTGSRREYAPVTGGSAPPKADHLLDLIRLSRWQEALKLLDQAAAQAGRGELEPEELAEVCRGMAEGLAETYRDLYEADETPTRYRKLWNFTGWAAYHDSLTAWMELFCQRLDQKFADFESKQKIRDAVRYIQQNFRAPINMAMVSNHVSMNYSLFSVLFKQYTGVNFVNFLQNLRLEEAKRLLLNSNLRVNEISAKAGFSGEKHFSKVFKAAVGLSPSDWRRLHLLKEGQSHE